MLCLFRRDVIFMIHRLAESIAYFYGKKVDYSKDEIEVCTYGLELMISDAIVMVLAMIISLITKTFISTVLLLTTFILLRHQAGGFHASSHFKCNIIFFVAYIMALFVIKLVPDESITYLVIILGALGVISIFMYAPVEHPNRPVSCKKKQKFRIKGIIYVIIFYAISVMSAILFRSIQRYSVGIGLGIFYAGISVVAEIKRQHLLRVSVQRNN